MKHYIRLYDTTTLLYKTIGYNNIQQYTTIDNVIQDYTTL